MGGALLRLEREPPEAWEQHLDPDVGVIALDQVAAVLLLGPGPVPDRDACRQPKRGDGSAVGSPGPSGSPTWHLPSIARRSARSADRGPRGARSPLRTPEEPRTRPDPVAQASGSRWPRSQGLSIWSMDARGLAFVDGLRRSCCLGGSGRQLGSHHAPDPDKKEAAVTTPAAGRPARPLVRSSRRPSSAALRRLRADYNPGIPGLQAPRARFCAWCPVYSRRGTSARAQRDAPAARGGGRETGRDPGA